METFKRILLVLAVCLLVAVATALLLASCSEQKTETFEKKATSYYGEKPETRLNWIGHWLDNHDRETLVREVAKAFTIKNPNIELNLRFPQSIRGCRSKRDIAKRRQNAVPAEAVVDIDPEQSAALPDDLLGQLYQAVVELDEERILVLRETIKTIDAHLAAALDTFVRELALSPLPDLLEKIVEPEQGDGYVGS